MLALHTTNLVHLGSPPPRKPVNINIALSVFLMAMMLPKRGDTALTRGGLGILPAEQIFEHHTCDSIRTSSTPWNSALYPARELLSAFLSHKKQQRATQYPDTQSTRPLPRQREHSCSWCELWQRAANALTPCDAPLRTAVRTAQHASTL